MVPVLILLTAAAVANPLPDDPCPTSPPFGFRLEVGYASGRIEADALARAREAARNTLLEKACAGVSDLRCASIKRHVHPWREGRFDRKTRSACAAVAIKADALQSWDQDLAKMRQELAALAEAIATRSGAPTVALDPPRWPSGCVAADVGPSLAAELRNGLARFPELSLVPTGGLQAPTVRFTLVPGKDAMTVSAALQEPGQPGERPLGGFSVPIDLFEVDPKEVGACRPWDRLGIVAGDLQVGLEVPTRGGELCEGEPFEPKVHVSGQAKVAVLSVGQDGTAYLNWPPPQGTGLITGSASLGQQRAVRPPAQLGDEVLLAVAVPADRSLGRFEGRTGFCKLPQPYDPALLPKGATVVSETYNVVTGGHQSCAPLADAERDRLVEVLERAPLCW